MPFRFPLPPVLTGLMLLFILLILWQLWRCGRQPGRWLVILKLLPNLAAATLLYIAGTWAFLSYHARYIFVLLVLLLTIRALWLLSRSRVRTLKRYLGWRIWRIFQLVVYVALIGAFLHGTYPHRQPYADLTFPFCSGTYYVMQGGGNVLHNPFHSRYSRRTYGYAMDISRVNAWGNRADHIFPNDASDYEIYADTVCAPCTGKVLHHISYVKDNPLYTLSADPVHGNFIIIQCDAGYRISMAHLLANSFFVRNGQRIQAGQPVALLGNTGFTVEPHLHIQAFIDYEEASHDPRGTSIPMIFNRRFLSLNERITISD